MIKFLNKIKKFLQNSKNDYKNDIQFSHKLAIFRFLSEVTARLRLKKITTYFLEKKNKSIINFLEFQLKNELQEFKNTTYLGNYDDNSPIWVCWWDGLSTAPELVKKCISSIKANSISRPVIIIDKTNYSSYLTVPEFFIEKVNSKKMLIAHFADYLRVSLIHKYGGLWLDATIFCSAPIPDSYFSIPFFSCKSKEPDMRYFSQKRWTSFVLGGFKDSDFFNFLKKSFESYWSKNDNAVDYLMFDHIIYLGIQNNKMFQDMIESLPPNNPHRDDLQAAMNDSLRANEFSNVINEDTILYKLSWRETYSLRTSDDSDSIYAHFISLKL